MGRGQDGSGGRVNMGGVCIESDRAYVGVVWEDWSNGGWMRQKWLAAKLGEMI